MTKRKRKKGEKKKGRVTKRNRVLANFSWVMKFIRAFVSAFGFALRKKAWKEEKWVDAVCQRDAPTRVNVFATYSYDYNVQLSSVSLPFRNLPQSACPTMNIANFARYEHVREWMSLLTFACLNQDLREFYLTTLIRHPTISLQFLRQESLSSESLNNLLEK